MAGVSYIVGNFIAAINEYRHQQTYRVYLTDCGYSICKKLGVDVKKRYFDLLCPESVDKRDGMEIAKERLARFGITVVS